VKAGENIWTWAGVNGTVWQIVTDPLNPSTVYARVDSNRIVKSTDGGNTWSDIANSAWSQVNKIAMAYTAPNILYTATTSGTFRTDDGGSVWQLVNADPNAQAVAVSTVDWREAYLSTYSTISKTVDGGLTWTAINSGLPSYPPFDDITIAPSAPHIMIAKPFNMANGPLYRSTNGGQNWSPIGGGYLVATNFVTFDPKNSDTIYLGTFSPGGWKSSDGGSNWQPLSNGLQQNGVGFVIDPDNTQVIHAANLAAGVLESLDGGASWAPINTGIQGLEVKSIAIASRSPLVIYAGLSSAGIWKMTRTTIQDYSITINNGALFTNQTTVTLTVTAPPGTTELMISDDGGFGGVTWEPFTTQKIWIITVYGDYVIPRVVYAKFKTYGQISGLYQDDIVLDVTAPTGTVKITDTVSRLVGAGSSHSVTIHSTLTDTLTNTRHLPLVARNAHPGFTLVELLPLATDDVSGVGEMLISNDVRFADAQWEAYATEKNWWVPDTAAILILRGGSLVCDG